MISDTQRIEALAAGLNRITLYENPDGDRKSRGKVMVSVPPGKRAGISSKLLRTLADGLIKAKA